MMTRARTVTTMALAMMVSAAAPALAEVGSCEALASFSKPNTTIDLARVVAPGEFSPPGGRGPNAVLKDLPGFCRVAATLRPTSDSDIKIEVWMPAAGWNGKFQAVGNGGWAGTISYSALAEALRRGYATSSTDTGHSTPGGSFVVGHPEKFVDFAWRSEHEMTLTAKAIINEFYGSGPRYSYWNGCSTGGRQGLMEAQRFPDDFDGIIAGAPANPRTRLGAWHMWLGHAALKDPASRLPADLYPVIHRAVLDACDAKDGVTDGVLTNPPSCRFDPAVLQCRGEDSGACLSAAQVDAVRKLYSPARHARTGAELFPGWEPGSELGWGAGIGGPDPYAPTLDHYRYIVFQDPAWDWRTFDFDSHVTLAQKVDNKTIDADDPNLKAFQGRGGKLLMYHGWNDTSVAPQGTVRYYSSVLDTMGGEAKTLNWTRLFMAPGMGHCGGGEGPNRFDMVTALEQWVEQGKAPERITASQVTDGKPVRTRPLCPYPQVAKYRGTGSADAAENFVCAAP